MPFIAPVVAVAAVVASVASAAMSAMSAIGQGKAAANAAEYNAAIDQRNAQQAQRNAQIQAALDARSRKIASDQAEAEAKQAEQNKSLSLQQANINILQQQVDARKRLGSMAASYGAAGVSSEGSPLDVLQESAGLAEQDRQLLEYQGALRSAGYQSQADVSRYKGTLATMGYDTDISKDIYTGDLTALGYRSDAQLNRNRAKEATQAGKIGAASAMISGVGKAFGMANDQGWFD